MPLTMIRGVVKYLLFSNFRNVFVRYKRKDDITRDSWTEEEKLYKTMDTIKKWNVVNEVHYITTNIIRLLVTMYFWCLFRLYDTFNTKQTFLVLLEITNDTYTRKRQIIII